MVPFRDYFVKEFASKTGITVNYNETNYDTWYQNCKNDGLNKTGAYDIYVMDDNWVPEFAAGKIVQSLDQLGLKANPDILPAGLNMGLWPPKSGPRMKDFADVVDHLFEPALLAVTELLAPRAFGVDIHDVGLEDGLGVPIDLDQQRQEIGAIALRAKGLRDGRRSGCRDRWYKDRSGRNGWRPQIGRRRAELRHQDRHVGRIKADIG